MEWKESIKELPEVSNEQGARCLGLCVVRKEEYNWTGYLDVFFHPTTGWKRCETEEQVCIIKWIYIKELENNNSSTS